MYLFPGEGGGGAGLLGAHAPPMSRITTGFTAALMSRSLSGLFACLAGADEIDGPLSPARCSRPVPAQPRLAAPLRSTRVTAEGLPC